MVHFEELTPGSQELYGHSNDRFMRFDSVREIDILRKAADARTAFRRRKFDDPFEGDLNYYSRIPGEAEGMFMNIDRVEEVRDLLEEFAGRTYVESRHWHPVRRETDRERARQLASEVLFESKVFDEVHSLASEGFFFGEQQN